MQEIDVANSITTGRPDQPAPGSAATDHDHQLLLLDGETVAELRGRVARVIDLFRGAAFGTLGDLAATLQHGLADRPIRAGVVAASADQAGERLAKLAATLDGDSTSIDVANGTFTGRAGDEPAIGYVFAGQGSDIRPGGDALTSRFAAAREFYRTATIPTADDPAALRAAQPRIAASSVAGVRVLSALGIEATVATGHSLGDITALHWAGAMSESALLALAAAHGQIMDDVCTGEGTMAVIAAAQDGVEPLLSGEPVVVAGYNNPAQTVIAGPKEAVARVRKAAKAAGLKSGPIPVADAFHTPAMAPAADPLRAHLAGMRFRPLERRVLSTVTGDVLPPDTDLRELLVKQLCEPVLFSQAVDRMGEEVSLIVEVGPGRLLSLHAAQICPNIPVIPLTTEDESLSGVLCTAAAAYVLGAPVRHDRLVAALHRSEKGT